MKKEDKPLRLRIDICQETSDNAGAEPFGVCEIRIRKITSKEYALQGTLSLSDDPQLVRKHIRKLEWLDWGGG